MSFRRHIVGPAFILALFTLMTGQAVAGHFDFTQATLGNAGFSVNLNVDQNLTILANFGFLDDDPLFLTKGVGTNGTVFWGDLGIGSNGLGVQDDAGGDTPTRAVDNNEALIFLFPDSDVFAQQVRLTFYGLLAGSGQVHIAALFAGSDGSLGYDFNGGIEVSNTSPTSTFDVGTIDAMVGQSLGMLVVYSNSGTDNLPFGVTALDVVPEPGGVLLVTTGLAVGLFWARKRRQTRP